jgi:hypothetical protein
MNVPTMSQIAKLVQRADRPWGLSENVDPSIQQVPCPSQKVTSAPAAADVVEQIRQAALTTWKECPVESQGTVTPDQPPV